MVKIAPVARELSRKRLNAIAPFFPGAVVEVASAGASASAADATAAQLRSRIVIGRARISWFLSIDSRSGRDQPAARPSEDPRNSLGAVDPWLDPAVKFGVLGPVEVRAD